MQILGTFKVKPGGIGKWLAAVQEVRPIQEIARACRHAEQRNILVRHCVGPEVAQQYICPWGTLGAMYCCMNVRQSTGQQIEDYTLSDVGGGMQLVNNKQAGKRQPSSRPSSSCSEGATASVFKLPLPLTPPRKPKGAPQTTPSTTPSKQRSKRRIKLRDDEDLSKWVGGKVVVLQMFDPEKAVVLHVDPLRPSTFISHVECMPYMCASLLHPAYIRPSWTLPMASQLAQDT